jgi:hypothetical protein
MTMAQGARVPRGGRTVVAGVWTAAGAVHLFAALHDPAPEPAGAWIAVLLAAAAVVGSVALIAGARPGTLLAAAVLGAVGVASFLVPRVVPLPGFGDVPADWADPWAFAGFLLDALVVRLAVFTLRRVDRVDDRRTRGAG